MEFSRKGGGVILNHRSHTYLSLLETPEFPKCNRRFCVDSKLNSWKLIPWRRFEAAWIKTN